MAALSNTQAKPSQLAGPVPGDDLAKAAAEFMAKQKPVSGAGLDSAAGSGAPGPGEDPQAYDNPAIPSEPPPVPSMGAQALDGAGRVLDYAGGLTRTGLANVAGMGVAAAQGKNPLAPENMLVTEGDLANAVKGKAPSSAEYLQRLGVPEGWSIGSGDTKITARGAAGFAFDIATDPLTSLVKTVKGIPYLSKMLNAGGAGTEALGKAVYASAVAKTDKELVKRGSGKLSEALIAEGAPVGTAAQIEKKVSQLSDTMGSLRQSLYDKAAEKGVSIDVGFPLKRAEAVLEKMRSNPGLAPAAGELDDLLARYKQAGKVTIDQLSEWKTALYDSLPSNAFNGQGKLKTQAKQFKAALAGDFREAIIGAGNKAEKGLGDAINAVNERWGTLIDANKLLEKSAAGSGTLGKIADGAILATTGVKGVMAKKAFEYASGTAARTVTGRALMEAGRRDLANRALRQGVAAASRTAPAEPPPDEGQ